MIKEDAQLLATLATREAQRRHLAAEAAAAKAQAAWAAGVSGARLQVLHDWAVETWQRARDAEREARHSRLRLQALSRHSG